MKRKKNTRRDFFFVLRLYAKTFGMSPETFIYRLLLMMNADRRMIWDERIHEVLSRVPVAPVVRTNGKGARLTGTGTIITREHVKKALEKTTTKPKEVKRMKNGKNKGKIVITIRQSSREKTYDVFLRAENKTALLDLMIEFIDELSKEVGIDILDALMKVQEENQREEFLDRMTKRAEKEGLL